MTIKERLRKWDGNGTLSHDEAKELVALLDSLTKAFFDERGEFVEYRERLKKVLKPDQVERALSAIELAQVRQTQMASLRTERDTARSELEANAKEYSAAGIRHRNELEASRLAHRGVLAERDAARSERDANTREYSAESIRHHNEYMNTRARLHQTIERVSKERDTAAADAGRYRFERDAKESIMGDCGLLLCEHFGDRSFWPREELPAGIQSLIEQVKEESEDAAKARAELAAGTKLMHEQQRQRDDYKHAAATLRTKLEGAEFYLEASRAEVEKLRNERDAVVSETDLIGVSISLDDDNRATEAKMIRSACSELARLRKQVAEREPRADLLDAMEEAGVDNWPGYSDAKESLAHDQE